MPILVPTVAASITSVKHRITGITVEQVAKLASHAQPVKSARIRNAKYLIVQRYLAPRAAATLREFVSQGTAKEPVDRGGINV